MLLIAQNLLELVLKKYLNTNLRRYIVVGGFAYVSEMFVIFICVHIFNFSNVVAVAISYWFGLVIAFLLQKLITFGNRDARLHILGKQVFIYCVLVAFNYSLTILAVNQFTQYASVYEVRTLVILFVTVVNYNVYKVIFRNLKSNNS
ncbi:MAG: GtrA family protein [Candidatus Saccharibacteria bacterium]